MLENDQTYFIMHESVNNMGSRFLIHNFHEPKAVFADTLQNRFS